MKMTKKLRTSRGVTLIEMITATGILALLALVLHSGLLMAQDSYRKSTSESESQLLLSTLTDLLSYELRYARDIVTEEDGKLERYTSVNYGRNTVLSLDGNRQLEANNRQMLSTGAYGNGAYYIESWNISYDGAGLFQVDLTVGGTHCTSRETTFSVRCLNGN